MKASLRCILANMKVLQGKPDKYIARTGTRKRKAYNSLRIVLAFQDINPLGLKSTFWGSSTPIDKLFNLMKGIPVSVPFFKKRVKRLHICYICFLGLWDYPLQIPSLACCSPNAPDLNFHNSVNRCTNLFIMSLIVQDQMQQLPQAT